MFNYRKLILAIWLILFALSGLILLIAPDHYTKNIVATLVFDCVAFISVLFLWLALFKNVTIPSESFYYSPTIIVSLVYLVIQFIICILEGIMISVLSFKVTMFTQITLMAIAWILMFFTLGSVNHIKKVDSRQKRHHVE